MAKPALWFTCIKYGFTVTAPKDEPPLDVRRVMAGLKSRVYIDKMETGVSQRYPWWRVELDPGFTRRWLDQLIDGICGKLADYDVTYRLGTVEISREKWVKIVLGD